MQSNNQENVVLCDERGRPLGFKEKLAAHLDGDLHIAFSVMVVRYSDQGPEYFLQQRAEHKYHSGGLWSNTVCSHPRKGELIAAAALRRMGEELGCFEPLRFKSVGHIVYRAALGNGLIEHEFDHILLAESPLLDVLPNPDEVSACRWWQEAEIEQALATSPERFTAWFSKVFNKARENLVESVE